MFKVEDGYDIAHSVKWSGFFEALLWAKWHYPTYRTSNGAEFDHTADSTNASLRLTYTKFGLETGHDPFMSEAIFRRFDFDNENRNPYFEMGEERLAGHAEIEKALWTRSEHEVILLIGEHNIRKFVTEDLPNLRATKVEISKANMVRMGKAGIWLVFDEDGREIRKVVIPSYHTQYLYYSGYTARGQMMDCLWNLAAALGGLRRVNATYFEYLYRRNVEVPPWKQENRSPKQIVISMLGWEKESGKIIPMSKVTENLKACIEREGIEIDETQSKAKQVHAAWYAGRVVTMAAAPQSEKDARAEKRAAMMAVMTQEAKNVWFGKRAATLAAKPQTERDASIAKRVATWAVTPQEKKDAIKAKRQATIAANAEKLAEKRAERQAARDKIKFAGKPQGEIHRILAGRAAAKRPAKATEGEPAS